MFEWLKKRIFFLLALYKVLIQISQLENYFHSHQEISGNCSHWNYLSLIDVIASSHWCHSSLAQSGFVINNSSSPSPY